MYDLFVRIDAFSVGRTDTFAWIDLPPATRLPWVDSHRRVGGQLILRRWLLFTGADSHWDWLRVLVGAPGSIL